MKNQNQKFYFLESEVGLIANALIRYQEACNERLAFWEDDLVYWQSIDQTKEPPEEVAKIRKYIRDSTKSISQYIRTIETTKHIIARLTGKEQSQ